MPRFYFDLHNDVDAPDEEGRELPDVEVAHRDALREARLMAAESVREGHLVLTHWIEVSDESHASLFKVSFGEAVKIVAAE